MNVFRAQSKLTGGKFDRAAPEVRDLVEKELREVTLTAEKQAAIIAKVVMIGRGDPLERIRIVSDTAEAFESVHGSAVALQRSMNAEHARLAAKWDADRAAER